MGERITAAVVAALAAALILVAGATGGAAQASSFDLTTPAGIDQYLVSKGLDPAKFVKQIGVNNYAGPASGCPGVGWNCTTSPLVIQVASAGGQNRAHCTDVEPSLTDTTQACVIVQPPVGSDDVTNHAVCTQHLSAEPDAEQLCDITQVGRQNSAVIHQVIDQSTAPGQRAVQRAIVRQTAVGSHNTSTVHQIVKQSTRTGSDQTQDAWQVASVTQSSTVDANNDSHVHQGQKQSAIGGITQKQNTNTLPTGFGDCSIAPLGPTNPNACAFVSQTTVDGTNDSHLHQLSHQDVVSTVATLQMQGSALTGSDGELHQDRGPNGRNANHAVQRKHQRAGAPGAFQIQNDPTGCCGASQHGGPQDVEKIEQTSVQSASSENFAQSAQLTASSNTPTGQCVLSQHARQNDDAAHFSETFDPCPAVIMTTSCASAGGEGIEDEFPDEGCPDDPLVTNPCEGEECEPPCTPPDCPILTSLPTTPTHGQEIETLDIYAEPR